MAICPFATYRPISTNHGGAMSAHLGLVVHVQQGDGSLFGFFNNPSARVSAHFWCSKTGHLEQYLDTDVVAWAEVNGNSSYVSCEFEGFDTESMTNAQLLSGAALFKWLSGDYGFPITGPVAHGQEGLTPHCNLDGSPDPAWGDHPCPGLIRLHQMPAIVYLASPPPNPTPAPSKEYEIMDSTTAANGDIVSHAVTPAGHYLEITRKSGDQGTAANNGLSIIDITAAFPQFTVQP